MKIVVEKLKHFIQKLLKTNYKDLLIHLIKSVPVLIKVTRLFIGFFILLIFFLIAKVIGLLYRIPFLAVIFKKFFGQGNKLSKLIDKIKDKLEASRSSEVKRGYLIALGYKNLMTKKTRTIITILGMSVGIGIIVLLISFGYGIERLVISRVAGLQELKMIDVSAGENTALRLNKEVLNKISKISQVAKSIPLVSVVGRVNYNKAVTDVLVYAVPRDYLELNKIKLLKGKLFSNNSTFPNTKAELGEVAGITTSLLDGELDTKVIGQKINFNVKPETNTIAWENCDISSKVIGYGKRIEGGYVGEEFWGGEYYPFNDHGREAYDKKKQIFLGRWIKANIPLYEKTKDENLQPLLNELGQQKWGTVCLQEKNIQIIDSQLEFGEVLGESTESASLVASDSAAVYEGAVVATDSSGIEIVNLQATESAKRVTQTLKFQSPPDEEAVVSSGLLNLLNIPVNKAIGKTFNVSFIIVKSLMPDIEGRIMTTEVNYKVLGVTDDNESTYFYVPFADLYKLSIKNFSQIKVVTSSKETLAKVRKSIETLGFRTTSTVDTVNQIESLFANLRILLGLLGLVALGVASLGMFNTLTVSLLERTREIGGMKAMGMVSSEVQDLFLAEAMIMGLSSGIGGLIIGIGMGKLLSLLISIFALSKGQAFMNLTYTPPYFIIFILISSFVVGALTGLYPAQRAKKISALNALRYE